MNSFEISKMNTLGLLDNLKSRISDPAALIQIEKVRDGIKNAKPSLSLLTKDWKESLNNVDRTVLSGLLESDNATETTTAVYGDRVEWDGICPGLTGTVEDYFPGSDSYLIEVDNGERVQIPSDDVSFERFSDKYNAFGEMPDNARNFWELPEKDREWVRNNRHTVSGIGFRIYEWNGRGDGFVILAYEDSDENAAMEQLYKARFGYEGK